MEIEKLPLSEQQRVIRFVRELSRSFRRIRQATDVSCKLKSPETSVRSTTVRANQNERNQTAVF